MRYTEHHQARTMRKARKVTQKALAQRAGVSAGTVCYVECHLGDALPASQRGTRRIRPLTAIQIAAALSNLPVGTYSAKEFVEATRLFPNTQLTKSIEKYLRQQRMALAA